MTNLIPMDITPVKLFSENGLEPILKEIKKKVDEFKPDTETAGGRKEIASFAYKIAQSKTFIDKAGKELVAKQKAEIKLIDKERKRSRDFLDEQKDRARQPLTDYEEAEKKAIEEEAAKIELEADHTEALEFHALWLKEKELEALKAKIAKEEEEKRQAEEAERIKKERTEREERLKKEAAERAKKDAEEAVRKAEEKAKQAERDRIAAEERAVFEKEEAVRQEKERAKAEAKRIEDEHLAKKAEEKAIAGRKARHHKHRKRIDSEALTDLEILGFDTEGAKMFIQAVANGAVRHITINY